MTDSFSRIQWHIPLFLSGSEIQPGQSATVQTVVESFRRNGVGLKGILTSPSTYKGGVLRTVNMKIR